MEKLLLAITGLGSKFEALQAKFETELAKAKSEPSTASASEIAELNNKLAKAEADVQANATKVTELTDKLQTAQNEVKALTEKAEKAEKKADETLAAMGVDPKTIPAAPARAAADTTAKSLWAQYHAITDPVAKTNFWRQNAAALKSARA